MKKKLLFISLLMGALLVSCNPNMNDNSSVKPDPGSDSSGEVSSSSEGGEGDASTEGEPTSEEGQSSESSDTSEDVPAHTHTYPSTPTRFDAEPNYATYLKGYNVYVCTYDGCNEEKKEAVYFTKVEMAAEMNKFIATKNYFDLFEAKQDLLANNYPVVDALTETEYFGYDLDNHIVALSSDTSVNHFVSFREKEVDNLDDLSFEISNIDADASSYSSIKLTDDLITNDVIAINSTNPIEINLNGHTIDNNMNNEPAFKVSKGNAVKPVLTITNGTIQTKEIEGFDMNKSPSCISVVDATSVRLSKVTLNNRAERGYCYIDVANKSSTVSAKIDHSVLTSKIVAICIQTNNNIIENNTIDGVVVVNGGTTVIDHNTVDVTHVQEGLAQEATTLITCQELYNACQEVFVNGGLDTYMLTSTDSILIYDRRSTHATYDNPEVTITNNTLKCKLGNNNTPYGYAIRYMDLKFDTTLVKNSQDLGIITVENNTYPYLDSSSPTHAGGYTVWEASA